MKVQRIWNSNECFIEDTSNLVLHGLFLLRLRHACLALRQHLPLTHLCPHPLQELRKSFPWTSMFFPSRSFPSKGQAIPCEGCNVSPFISASIFACTISIFRRSIARCLLINKCLDAHSLSRLPRSAIVSSVLVDSIHL